MDNSTKKIEKNQNDSRLVPFTVAAVVCFCFALILGVGGWYLFGTNHHLSPEKDSTAVQISNRQPVVENSNIISNVAATNAAPAAPEPETVKAPAGEIPIEGGEITLGGDGKIPLRRVVVRPFAIGATEVTNGQYAEFVEETKHAAPVGWSNNKFPDGDADKPVVGVSWQDANDYCEWLSKKLNAAARLPSEAEWEMAARAASDFKYPWGREWNDKAAQSAETKGKVQPVKSFPEGRTPQGAYDMVGNVWEWTSDLLIDESGAPILRENAKQRVIKSGSVEESRNILTSKIRAARPENQPKAVIGFRYVIVRR